MYNQEVKERYIEEKNSISVVPNNYLQCQFKKIEKMEIELNKDVKDFTTYEIIEYYKTLNVSSLESLIVMNSHFSLYVHWCLHHNIVKDNQNHFLEIDEEQLKNCLNNAIFKSKIITREQLLSWCEQLPNPKDQVILLGLFEGLKGKNFIDLFSLKISDIEGHQVKLSTGRTISISNQLLRYIEDSINTDIYYSVSENQLKRMPLVYKGFVIKYYPNTKDNQNDYSRGRIIYNGIKRCLKYLGVNNYINASSIFDSGKIDMIKRRSSEIGITAKEYLYSNKIQEVNYKYNCTIIRSRFWLKYKDYLEN